MTVDFRTKGEGRLSLYNIIQKLINQLPDDMIGEKNTTAPSDLFDTSKDEKETLLDKKGKDLFHTITATTLFNSRVRADFKLRTGFCCTRVKNQNKHDHNKLSHMMKYLQKYKYLPLILQTEGNGVSIYLDGSYSTHADMKGYSGKWVMEGKGGVYSMSTKHKINILSSTEAEIVTVGETLPKLIWYCYFCIEQGGSLIEDVLLQDNQSTMLIENRGRFSCQK